MTHLTSDELIDAMEGMLAPDRQAHLATCEQCRRELAGLSSVLSEARQTSVPEPSPLFWPHFSQRIRVAIDHDAARGSHRPAWLRWPVLLPLGAVAIIIMALMIALPEETPNDDPSLSAALQASEALEAPEALDRWVMLANLVGDIDLDTAAAAGVMVTPGVAEQAVLALTAEERQELTRLLEAELTRAKS
jgi:hypothetical protein